MGPMRRALRLAPESVDVLFTAAQIHLEMKDKFAAILKLKRARRIDPEASDVHALLALCYYKLGFTRRAIATLDEAFRLDPTCQYALWVREQFGYRNLSSKIQKVTPQEMLRQNPESPAAHLAMSEHKLAEGEVDQGYWHAREALRQQPNSAQAAAGLNESLRHRFPVYNWAYRNGLKSVQRSAGPLAILGFFLLCALNNVPHKESGGIVSALILVAICPIALFLAGIVFPMPIVNLVRRLHPVARHTLSGLDKVEMAMTCGIVLHAVLCADVYAHTRREFRPRTARVHRCVQHAVASAHFRSERAQPRRRIARNRVCLASIWHRVRFHLGSLRSEFLPF